jgi:hypothetical protein
MSKSTLFNNVRIIPREADFLERNIGSKGDVFFEDKTNTLRLYDGVLRGGYELAKNDLSNIGNADFLAKAQESGVGSGVGVADSAPSSPTEGELWWDSSTGNLYIYFNDGDSNQWVQPRFVSVGSGSGSGSFSGSYNDLTDKPSIPTAVSQLTNDSGYVTNSDIGTIPTNLQDLANVTDITPTNGQVLKWDGQNWTPGTDYGGAAGADLASLSVSIGTATGGGALSYDSITSTFNFSPANLSNYALASSLSNYVTTTSFTGFQNGLSTVATSGSYNDLDNRPALFDGDYTSLSNIPSGYSSITITDSILSGITTFGSGIENLTSLTGATGTVDHDFSSTSVFYHLTPAADFTANFTNVPTTNNKTITIALLIGQGSTAYLPIGAAIDGITATINWQGGTPPTGTVNAVDVVSFTLIRLSNNWTVIGSLTSYG